MSRWYGQGGHWINHGLPRYVAIDRKPENGCEIQNSACGRSGVMLRLELVKGIDLVGKKDDNDDPPTNASLLHGMNVLKHVVLPWFGPNRIVCADSYFAILCFGWGGKGVVQKWPPIHWHGQDSHKRFNGNFVALASDPADNQDPTMAAYVWMDCEQR